MSGAHVFIDRSQFPGNVRNDLVASLRARALNHKFHYESYKQAARWLALHEAYSPARTDASCSRIYDAAFSTAALAVRSPSVHVVGLGCGGGQKEARLLKLLRAKSDAVVCTLSDVSLPLLLTAGEAALPLVKQNQLVLCDLGSATDLAEAVNANDHELPRIVTLFGIIPNFEPGPLLSRAAQLLRPTDLLIISANLAPGSDYEAGVEKVLPQYENGLTRDWLMTFLLDLGFEESDGDLSFSTETDARGFHRIVAHYELSHPREIALGEERFSFRSGERIRVFFSYRHRRETMDLLVKEHGLEPRGHWLNDSAEEGVFLCRRSGQPQPG